MTGRVCRLPPLCPQAEVSDGTHLAKIWAELLPDQGQIRLSIGVCVGFLIKVRSDSALVSVRDS